MVTAKTFKVVLACVGFFFLAGIFITCRYCFGTYSLFEAAEIYNNLITLDQKYKAMFVRRENLRYHIGSSEARGETQEAMQMSRDLEALDDDLDALEVQIRLWKTGSSGRAGGGSKDHQL